MLLAVDVGNTTISLAVMKGGKIKKAFMVPVAAVHDDYKKLLRNTLASIKRYSRKIDAVIVCSVVPEALSVIKSILIKGTGTRLFIVGRDIKTPMKNLYRRPRQVGQDRLVCAYAAARLYGRPAIVVDFGTAVTFDVVSARGEYLGGAIIPGLRLAAESLFEKTALLPRVRLDPPKDIIGKDTENSIRSGIFYGYGALCDGMISRIAKKIKQKPVVVITGGYASRLTKFIKTPHTLDKNLIFKGMDLIYCKVYSRSRL
ncbi:MAG TPA: type III pantothenate kinase [Candidatus Omnitrophota bacterium]|nr:type III pantothenate kinase [Candidatus Omnitrophota bacterium]HPD83883.1 type III pantothenate kinase [Candidatus Omnitrophota bacterium]HRZ02740.1 type III pantothenate kinase [Candidatus Omnitrophota bacterium]